MFQRGKSQSWLSEKGKEAQSACWQLYCEKFPVNLISKLTEETSDVDEPPMPNKALNDDAKFMLAAQE